MSETQTGAAVNHFTIQGRLPSLNDYTRACRSHWSKGAEYKRDVEADIIWQIRAARNKGTLHPVACKIVLHVEWHESDQRRDVDNIVSAKKFILDAMQKAGIIPNDNRKYVAGVYDEIIDDTTDFVKVIINPVE